MSTVSNLKVFWIHTIVVGASAKINEDACGRECVGFRVQSMMMLGWAIVG